MVHYISVQSEEDSMLVRVDQIALTKQRGRAIEMAMVGAPSAPPVTVTFKSEVEAKDFVAAILAYWRLPESM